MCSEISLCRAMLEISANPFFAKTCKIRKIATILRDPLQLRFSVTYLLLDMTGDTLTKSLGNILFLKHRAGMGFDRILGNNSDPDSHNQSD